MKKDDIIKKVESKFGKDKFEFSLLSETRNYKGEDVLDLICKKHGEFSITLGTILKKDNTFGCPDCKKDKLIEDALNIIKENRGIDLRDFCKINRALVTGLSVRGIKICELFYNQEFKTIEDFQCFIDTKKILNSTDFKKRFPGVYDLASELKFLTELNYPNVLWSRRNIAKMTLEEVQNFIEENNIKTISDFEKTDPSMLTIIRRNKDIYNKLELERTKSFMEDQIKRLLKRNNISYIPQKTFDWLIYNKHLFLDFYIPEINLAIECQGCQHWIFCDEFGFNTTKDDFNALIERNKIKFNLCKSNNIDVIYFVSQNTAHFKEIPKEMLSNYLNTVYTTNDEILSHINNLFQNNKRK